MQQTYTLERSGLKHLRFQGEQLACMSSRDDDSVRWTELALYRTTTGAYVLSQIGRTLRDDEVDRHGAFVCETPAAVLKALERPPHGTLTNLAKDLLEEAGTIEPVFAEILVEELT